MRTVAIKGRDYRRVAGSRLTVHSAAPSTVNCQPSTQFRHCCRYLPRLAHHRIELPLEAPHLLPLRLIEPLVRLEGRRDAAQDALHFDLRLAAEGVAELVAQLFDAALELALRLAPLV